MYACMHVCMHACMCSPVSCLRSAVQHRACVCSTLLSVHSFFLRSGDVECMTAAELANSHACALPTPGRLDGVEGGHEKSQNTRLRCRPMCVVNTCVTSYVLLCGTARVPRCVHPFRVCAVLCNTVLVCSRLLSVHSFFLRSGDVECMTAAELANSTP